jgi:Tol biopolymer transport system component
MAQSSIPAAVTKSPIVFQEGGQVRILSPDGSARAVTTAAPTHQEHPDWSPDGKQLVFETAFSELWAVNADGSQATKRFDCQLPCHAIQDAAWSPDGRTIAFVTAETKDGQTTSRAAILALDVATGKVRTIHDDSSGVVWLYGPRWSPDGRSLVFEEDAFASNLLTEDNISSTKLGVTSASGVGEPVDYIAAGASGPDWSPKGDLIVFSRGDNLLTIRPDGTGEHRLTNFDGVNEHAIQPSFVPGGGSLIFTYVSGGPLRSVNDHHTAGTVGLDGSGMSTVGGGLLMTHSRMQP